MRTAGELTSWRACRRSVGTSSAAAAGCRPLVLHPGCCRAAAAPMPPHVGAASVPMPAGARGSGFAAG
jgi:hypothetical protein